MNDFLEKIQKEYDKLRCPVCGCIPRVVPTGGNSFETHCCGHQQMEDMINEAEDRLVSKNNDNLIGPFKVRVNK